MSCLCVHLLIPVSFSWLPLYCIVAQQQYASYRNTHLWVYFTGVALWMAALWFCINRAPSAILQRFAWGMAGGSLTGIQCFLKDALTILKVSNDKRPWKLPWTLYFLTALAIGSSVGGLSILTQCMKRYDATFSNAMNAGSFVVSSGIMSAVHYHTFSNFSSKYSSVMYPTGLAIILVGLWILVRNTHEVKVLQDKHEYDTIAKLKEIKEGSLELTTVEESEIEESVELMARRRSRTASASSVDAENFGLVHRSSSTTSAGLTPLPNRDRAASSSSVNRDRTASTSSLHF